MTHMQDDRVGEYARADAQRGERTGIPEFIYGPGKTPGQIAGIAAHLRAKGAPTVLATKVAPAVASDVIAAVQADGGEVAYHEDCGILVFGAEAPDVLVGNVTIVTAGTADLPLAREAELVCRSLGSAVHRIADIGVAGVHRVFDVLDRLREAHVVICVAGMEGALPSVVGGLLSAPVIALPSSVGYGVNAGGYNALLSALGSCVPGLLTVNIDNGVGAAAAAHRINLLAVR